MKNSNFLVEVKDLIKCIRIVLMVIVQMKEYEKDFEMLVDFQYSLVNFYVSIFELWRIWLESMVKIYVRNGDLFEVVMCYIYIVVFIVEYLKRKGYWKVEKICIVFLFLEDIYFCDSNLLLIIFSGGSMFFMGWLVFLSIILNIKEEGVMKEDFGM